MNRQVPKRYCLIGDGKVARHMAHYFDLLGISYTRWFRSNKRSPLQKIKQLFKSENKVLLQALRACDHVLLLISDDQINKFIQTTPELKGHDLIHFSGALTTPLAAACHPLMTFNHGKYDISRYQEIPFVHQSDFDFETIFPELVNPHHVLVAGAQSKYHAYCVMAGNFSQLMWRALGAEMQQLGLPEEVMHAYILQNAVNFTASPNNAATGPLERGDEATINKHLEALVGGDLENIYRAYLNWQKPQEPQNINNIINTNSKKVAS